jgi:capsular polysaccharide biosynthesis protein
MAESTFEKDIDFRSLFFFFLKKLWILVLAAVLCAGAFYLYSLRNAGPGVFSSTRQIVAAVSHDSDEVVLSRSEQQVTSTVLCFYWASDPIFLQGLKEEGLLAADFNLSGAAVSSEYPKQADGTFTMTVSMPTAKEAAELADAITEGLQENISALDWYVDAQVQVMKSVDGISVSASSLRYAAVFGMGGFLVAAFFLFIYFVTRKKIDTGAEVEFYAKLPFLGTVKASATGESVNYAAARALTSLDESKTLAVLSFRGDDSGAFVSALAREFRTAGRAVCNCLIAKGAQYEYVRGEGNEDVGEGDTTLTLPSLIGAQTLLPNDLTRDYQTILYSAPGFPDQASSYWLGKSCNRSILLIRKNRVSARQLREWLKALDLEREQVVGVLMLAK